MQTAPAWIPQTEPGQFNRACLLGTALWLLVTAPLGLVWRSTDSDFAQFYMGGLMTRTGQARWMYPIPDPEVVSNPGLAPDSDLTPQEAKLRKRYDVPDDTRYILPPVSALLFIPLSFLPYGVAQWLWYFLLIGCVWGVAVYAGRFYQLISGRPTIVPGILAWLVVLSPAIIRSIRISNTTPIIALMLAVAAEGMLRSRPLRTAAALLLGGLLKYVTFALVPLVLAKRQWRALFWLAVIAAAATLVDLAVVGPAPFKTFQTQISPLLKHPSPFLGNQTLHGLMQRIYDPGEALPQSWARALDAVRAVTLLTLLFLILRRPPRDYQDPVYLFAGCCAGVAWFCAFSPIAWEHFPVFFCPFWGWLWWECQGSRGRIAVGVALYAVLNAPLSIIRNKGFMTHPVILPEWLNSSQLYAFLILLALACLRLVKVREPAVSSVPHQENPDEKPVLTDGMAPSHTLDYPRASENLRGWRRWTKASTFRI